MNNPTMTAMLAEDIQREHLRVASRHRHSHDSRRPPIQVSDHEPRERARKVLARWAWLR